MMGLENECVRKDLQQLYLRDINTSWFGGAFSHHHTLLKTFCNKFLELVFTIDNPAFCMPKLHF